MNRRQFLSLALLVLSPPALSLPVPNRPCWVLTHPNHAEGEYIATVKGRQLQIGKCEILNNSEVQQLHNRGYILFRRF